MANILIVEDNHILREEIAAAFSEIGHSVREADDGNRAFTVLEEEEFDVVITDMKLPGKNGLDVVKFARQINDYTSIIVITAYGTVESAVEAMKSGACDYIQKPFRLEEMEFKVLRASEHSKLKKDLGYYRHSDQAHYHFDNIVGKSGCMQHVFDLVKKVARSNTTVLIHGETGTGKELIAGAIHSNSLRKAHNFIKVNCAVLLNNLLESELFGHEKGAFTGADRQRTGKFEQANGGTLFLDEIGDMHLSTQAKILRVLQEQEFERLGGSRTIKIDVRLIVATNKNLKKAISRGAFREDLFFRLNVVDIEVPPLRSRKEDILPLANHFLRVFNGEFKKKVQGFDPRAVKLLKNYDWPGNVRELENVIERSVLMIESPVITVDDISLSGLSPQPKGITDDGDIPVQLPKEGITLEEVERRLIIEALKRCNWVQKDAAKLLGISRRVINYKIKNFNIGKDRWNRKQ
jgi:DNA-binding NtrC family response regulator